MSNTVYGVVNATIYFKPIDQSPNHYRKLLSKEAFTSSTHALVSAVLGIMCKNVQAFLQKKKKSSLYF